MSEGAVSYAFEQLAPSPPPTADGLARTLAEADAEAQEIRERAQAEGYAEGRNAGFQGAAAEVESALIALRQAVERLGDLESRVAEAIEHEAIELALALAGKIVAGAMEARPQLVLEVVQGALRRLSGQRVHTVLVNPEDLEIVRSAATQLQAHGEALTPHSIQADARIQPGGALVRTSEGELDVGLQTQLERAREAIAAELEVGSSTGPSDSPSVGASPHTGVAPL